LAREPAGHETKKGKGLSAGPLPISLCVSGGCVCPSPVSNPRSRQWGQINSRPGRIQATNSHATDRPYPRRPLKSNPGDPISSFQRPNSLAAARGRPALSLMSTASCVRKTLSSGFHVAPVFVAGPGRNSCHRTPPPHHPPESPSRSSHPPPASRETRSSEQGVHRYRCAHRVSAPPHAGASWLSSRSVEVITRQLQAERSPGP
jgi:hypothetical protein